MSGQEYFCWNGHGIVLQMNIGIDVCAEHDAKLN